MIWTERELREAADRHDGEGCPVWAMLYRQEADEFRFDLEAAGRRALLRLAFSESGIKWATPNLKASAPCRVMDSGTPSAALVDGGAAKKTSATAGAPRTGAKR
jgi:hypothetical protein